MINKGRLLDLALAYALDNPAIHQDEPDNVTALRELHSDVLVDLRDGTELATAQGVSICSAHRETDPDCPRCRTTLSATAQSPAGPDFLTGDERRFFAYMATQRFRTVSEMDPEVRERVRARWQEVALWFDPSWEG